MSATNTTRNSARWWLLWVAWLLVVGSTGTGCVRRRLTVRSNPPGAHVFIDDQEIGFTPVSTSFVYYGTRTVRLERDGFETLTVRQKFNPTWYEVPPLDFFSETVYPGELRDERVLDFQLIPAQIVPQQDLLNRAEGLRGSASQGQAIPLVFPGFGQPPVMPQPPATPAPYGVLPPPQAKLPASALWR